MQTIGRRQLKSESGWLECISTTWPVQNVEVRLVPSCPSGSLIVLNAGDDEFDAEEVDKDYISQKLQEEVVSFVPARLLSLLTLLCVCV